MDNDRLQLMREGIAKEYGIALYRSYGEQEAAGLLRKDYSTVKRWRRDGRIPYVKYGDGGVRYLGIHIVDIIALGDEAIKLWDGQNTTEGNTSSGTGSSGNAPAAPHGTDAGTSKRPEGSNASASVARILRKPSNG